jgi:oligopeptide/dipeptide ABC transporter ATP-binding protein
VSLASTSQPTAGRLGAVAESLLHVSGLTVGLDTDRGTITAVDDVSFAIGPGETLALVGESGSGKSLTAAAILRVVPAPGRILRGEVRFRGRDLLALSDEEIRRVRGAEIALIVQEPSTALNPVLTIGDQIAETLVAHARGGWTSARAQAIDLLAAVRFRDPAVRATEYPHQLSGGQRQRVLIAMALACSPALLIADEPTTALDVRVQAEILDLLRAARERSHLSLLLITHDLAVVASLADRVAVMYAGRIVEEGAVAAVFDHPAHPYTQALLASVPRPDRRGRLLAIEGTMPVPGALPEGCAFEPRCAQRQPRCRAERPPVQWLHQAHMVRCVLHGGVAR